MVGGSAYSADDAVAGKLSGKGYFEYNHPMQDNKGFPQFRFTRFYFAYDYKLSDNVQIIYRLDVDRSTELDDEGQPNDRLRPFLKHGYVAIANLIPASILYAGMQGTPKSFSWFQSHQRNSFGAIGR